MFADLQSLEMSLGIRLRDFLQDFQVACARDA